MKKILLSAACVAAFGAAPALAQDEAGSESAWDISGTFGVVSDYMFRGVSQTQGDAAIQASFTISHDSGFYGTVWGSNVDFGDETDFEVDFTLGYGGSIDDATSYDVNVTYYAYPNEPDGSNYGYYELIAGITHDFGNGFSAGAKVAFSPENFGDTGNAFWVGVNGTYAATDWLSVSANVGYVGLDDTYYIEDTYFHYDIGATVYYGILGLDIRYVGTDSDVINDDKVVGSAIFSF